jgi:hypothetical protein
MTMLILKGRNGGKLAIPTWEVQAVGEDEDGTFIFAGGNEFGPLETPYDDIIAALTAE